MNSHYVYTVTGKALVDLSTVVHLAIAKSEEKLVPGETYDVVALGITQNRYYLATSLTEEGAKQYLEDMRIALNANRRKNDTRPVITKHHDIIADQDRNDIVFCLGTLLDMVKLLIVRQEHITPRMTELMNFTTDTIVKLGRYSTREDVQERQGSRVYEGTDENKQEDKA